MPLSRNVNNFPTKYDTHIFFEEVSHNLVTFPEI